MSEGGFGAGPFGVAPFGDAAAPAPIGGAAGEWGVLFNGIYLSGGSGLQFQDILTTPACSGLSAEQYGCLITPPDGLGLPGLRTEDVTYPQRDGVRHFRDWYEPRIITLDVAVGPDTVCTGCSPRAAVQKIVNAWSRQCDDEELVIFTDCHGTETEFGGTGPITGPYGVIGRPRQALVTWDRSNRRVARLTLRFDAVDHRMYVLDQCGTPGSGEKSCVLLPSIDTACRDYPRCYDTGDTWCYDEGEGQSGNECIAEVEGTLCACATIILHGQLTNPTVINITTGERISYDGFIGSSNAPIIIDGENFTATQAGASRTHLLTGSGSFCLDPGENQLVLSSFGQGDDGWVEVIWRDQVEQA